MFFKRGSGPLVSIFLVSRGRPNQLREAIKSCLDNSKDHSLLEFIIKLDTDDLASYQVADEFMDLPIHFTIMVTDRGKGYAEMHNWLNDMVRQARGDWILILNDDARIVTPDWDQVLLVCGGKPAWIGIDDICMFVLETDGDRDPYGFPCIRKKGLDLLGHFALHPFGDTWLFTAYGCINAIGSVPIKVKHTKEWDETRTANGPLMSKLDREIRSFEVREQIILDALKLNTYLLNLKNTLEWTNKPTINGWYWFKDELTQVLDHTYYKNGEVLLSDPSYAPKDLTKTKWSLRQSDNTWPSDYSNLEN